MERSGDRRAESGVPLPDSAIAVVRRADGSGTSFLFTNYLSKANPDWKAKVGEGTAVNWPTGAGGKGNERVGVCAAFAEFDRLRQYAYAKQNKMSYVQMRNSAGNFVAPSDSSFKSAAAGASGRRVLTRC